MKQNTRPQRTLETEMARSNDDALTTLRCAAECLDCGSLRLAQQCLSRLGLEHRTQAIPLYYRERITHTIEHAAHTAARLAANTACLGYYIMLWMISHVSESTESERALMEKLAPGVVQWDGSTWGAAPDAPTFESCKAAYRPK